MRLYVGYYGSTKRGIGNELICNVRPFNTHKIYIKYYASLNKQMIQLCEKVYYGHFAFPAIAILFNHRLQLLQWNTNSIGISFIRKERERERERQRIFRSSIASLWNAWKSKIYVKLIFKKSTYPGFFLQGTEKIVRVTRFFELSGFKLSGLF